MTEQRMKQGSNRDEEETDPYRFEGLPLEPIPPGQNILVAGPPHVGVETLALRMVAGSLAYDEAAIVITTDTDGQGVLRSCRQFGSVDDERIGLIDCVGGTDELTAEAARLLRVSGPDDLTGIGMRYSKLCAAFNGDGVQRVRMAISSVSTLLSFGDVQRTSRFVHTIASRNAAIDGLGLFLLDPETQDERTVRTLAHFCDGRIQVRDGGEGPELRVRGIPGPREWTRFDPEQI